MTEFQEDRQNVRKRALILRKIPFFERIRSEKGVASCEKVKNSAQILISLPESPDGRKRAARECCQAYRQTV